MDHDMITRLAMQAGATATHCDDLDVHEFAALIAEECAKLCDGQMIDGASEENVGCLNSAADIREKFKRG